MTKISISSIGKDKPGIVGAFTKVLYDFNCNIEDSSMTILCNQFSMILILSTEDDLNVEELKKALKNVEDKFHLRTNIGEICNNNDTSCTCPVPNQNPYVICVSGLDQSGIAYHISEILSKYNINITDFNSKIACKHTNPIYVMMIEVDIPESFDLENLERELKTKAQELNLELKINAVDCCEL